MSDRRRPHRDDDEFIEEISRPLRAPETLPDDFELRVMAAAMANAYPSRRPAGSGDTPAGSREQWWRRRYTMTISPLAGFALAAGFAGLVALGTLAATPSVTSGDVDPVAVAASSETVHVLRFVFVDSGAREVALVGDFNEWRAGATPLRRDAAGTWSVEVPLERGRHEYAFIVDGERWAIDPFGASHLDEFGTESSVVNVGLVGNSAS